MEINNKIPLLIFKFWEGTLSADEQELLGMWRTASPANEQIFQKALDRAAIDRGIHYAVQSDEEREQNWMRLRQVINKRSRNRIWKQYIKYAAILLLPLGVGISAYLLSTRDSNTKIAIAENLHTTPSKQVRLILEDGNVVPLTLPNAKDSMLLNKAQISIGQGGISYGMALKVKLEYFHTLDIPRGAKYQLMLSDGTKVYLNAESRLRYPSSFNDVVRKVYLEGEAYFEVAKKIDNPFVVHTDGMDIQVLGTSFAVRTYKDEEHIQATLIEGKVSVKAGSQVQEIVPGNQAVYNKNSDWMNVRDVDVTRYVAWMYDKLIYNSEPLDLILRDIGRMCDCEFEFTDEQLKTIPFTLNMVKQTSFRKILAVIEATGKVKFEIRDDNRVFVKTCN